MSQDLSCVKLVFFPKDLYDQRVAMNFANERFAVKTE